MHCIQHQDCPTYLCDLAHFVNIDSNRNHLWSATQGPTTRKLIAFDAVIMPMLTLWQRADTIGQRQNIWPLTVVKSELVPYSIMSIGHGAAPGFLAISPQVTLVINLVVGCRYFPSVLQLLFQPRRSPLGCYQIILLESHTGVSSLPMVTTQWCPAGTRTHDQWIASPMPYQQCHRIDCCRAA